MYLCTTLTGDCSIPLFVMILFFHLFVDNLVNEVAVKEPQARLEIAQKISMGKLTRFLPSQEFCNEDH